MGSESESSSSGSESIVDEDVEPDCSLFVGKPFHSREDHEATGQRAR